MALAAVFTATGAHLTFQSAVGVYAPYLPFTLAVTVVSFFGGRRPGLVTGALSVLAVDWFFVSPHRLLGIENPATAWAFGLFAVTAASIALLVGSLRGSLLALARADEALRRQSQLIDLSHDAVITLDRHRRIIGWNKGAEETYGWLEQEAAGKMLHELLQTASDVSIAELDEILHREGRWDGEMGQTAKDGRGVVVDSRQVLLGNVRPECTLAINRDITERKKAEEALRQSEDQFRTLANTIPQLCGMADPDGRFFWVNQRWCDYTGLTPEESEGWGWMSALDRDASPDALELWRHSIAVGAQFESVFAVRGADGVVRPFLALAMPMRNRDGEVVRWFGTMTDISQQRKTEDALRKAHDEELARATELQAIMDAAPVALVISRDQDCRYILGNHCAYDLLREPPGSNLSKSQPEGQNPAAYRVIRNGIDVPPHELPLHMAAATGQAVCDVELELAFPDGSRSNVIGNAVPLLDCECRPLGAVGVFVDITERKKTEERLRQAQKLESIGLLAGGIAHDFNNLLTVIMGSADLALRRWPSCDEMRHVVASSERAAHLTRQLLAYAGKGQFVSETFNLTDLVSRYAERLSASIPKNVQLRFNLSPDLLIKADPRQIEQIVMNLVMNASEAIPPETEGRIEITTSTCEVASGVVGAHAPLYDARPGKFVCLEVSDNGSGMDEGTLAEIFSPFFSTKFAGRGLGLAAVQGVVRSCKGFVEVQSSLGAGSRFRVFLPAAGKEPFAVLPASPLPGASRRREPTPAAVLIVDDEEMLRELASTALKASGYEVREAKDGRGALETLAGGASTPSLVLLDLTMAAAEAEELVPILNRKYPDLRIIVISDYPEEEARREFPAGGVTGFLQKPYTVATLMDKVERTLHSGGGPNEENPAAA